jgi:hypothetical protein
MLVGLRTLPSGSFRLRPSFCREASQPACATLEHRPVTVTALAWAKACCQATTRAADLCPEAGSAVNTGGNGAIGWIEVVALQEVLGAGVSPARPAAAQGSSLMIIV